MCGGEGAGGPARMALRRGAIDQAPHAPATQQTQHGNMPQSLKL